MTAVVGKFWRELLSSGGIFSFTGVVLVSRLDDRSRMTRECHVRIWGASGGSSPGPPGGDYEQSMPKKRTRRERFLAEMEAVVPWKVLVDLIGPHDARTSSKGGRPLYPLKTMLRIHLLQHGYDLSDPAMEDALIEVATMHRFAGIALIADRIPGKIQSLLSGICWIRTAWVIRFSKP